MQKHRVILCTDGIFPQQIGGMQRHSRLLAETLAQRGNTELTVIHPHSEKVFNANLGITEIQIEGIDTEKLYLKECYAYSQRVARELEKLHANSIIYSQGLSVWANIKKYSHRLVINPHGLEPYQVLSFKEQLIAAPFRLIFNYLFKRSRIVVSLGGKLTHLLKDRINHRKGELVVLANGVLLKNAILPSQQAQNKFNFLFVSRFAHNKGIGTLFEALEHLQTKGLQENFTFHLVGKGPLFDHYQKQNPYSNVIIHGFLSDDELEIAYKASDLFVLPTWFEGMPTVVLEAMSFAKPVAVSDVGASAELVGSDNGYLLAPRDSIALANAIASFMELSLTERIKMGEVSFAKVRDNFTWDKVAEKHERLFAKLAEELGNSSLN
jgi:glycosyltransferase involved in cell wall biosynthesis